VFKDKLYIILQQNYILSCKNNAYGCTSDYISIWQNKVNLSDVTIWVFRDRVNVSVRFSTVMNLHVFTATFPKFAATDKLTTWRVDYST